jgi:hypothetical protein
VADGVASPAKLGRALTLPLGLTVGLLVTARLVLAVAFALVDGFSDGALPQAAIAVVEIRIRPTARAAGYLGRTDNRPLISVRATTAWQGTTVLFGAKWA